MFYSRNEKYLPMKPGFWSFIFQFLAILSILLPKQLLISTALIMYPYYYPLGMLVEFLIIALVNFILYGSIYGGTILFDFGPYKATYEHYQKNLKFLKPCLSL